MDDAKVQKPWIEAVFCGTNVMRLMSYLRLKTKIDFIRRGIPSWMHREYSLKCERQQLCYEILKRLQVEVRPRNSDFTENWVSSLKNRGFLIFSRGYRKIPEARNGLSEIISNAISSNLNINKSQNFPTKLKTLLEVSFFTPPVICPFISD